MTRVLLLGMSVVLMLAACGDGGDVTAETTTTGVVDDDVEMTTDTPEQPDDQQSPMPTEPQPTESGPEPEAPLHSNPRIATALADLASRLNVAAESIEIESAEEVTWSDGSLGCPEPGMMYTQALEPGIQIILKVEGTAYHYHANTTDDPFFCANPSSPSSGVSGDA
ncbi:MAG: hypothetical protein QNJ77_09610 [Acidimicrobiia bacterium]|nr:hypothetical protein [Acidimicrobiia bacterium]